MLSSTIPCLCALFYLLAPSLALVQVLPSSKSYGPDGPWQTVNVSLGTPAQFLQLLPGGTFASSILSYEICADTSLPTPCGTGGLYDPDESDSVDQDSIEFVSAPITNFKGAEAAGSHKVMMDQLQIPRDGFSPWSINNFSIAVVHNLTITLPDGSGSYGPQLGTLSLGGPGINHSFTPASGPQINASLVPAELFRTNTISTNTYGLHIGSAAMDIPLSLWFGGYDRSRILGPVSSQPYTRFDFLMDLLDIGIGVDNGASPFEFSERQGILRQGSASMGDSTQVILDPQSPYLYLPQSTCDAIASYLPVTYQSKYKLYFWDTKDPKYQPIITSPSYLSFTFRASNMEQNNITVKVPFQLLNLTLQMPIIDTPTQYFPCQPVGAKDSPSYTLGRAFLQAAFLGVHWDEDRGLFYLAQAPGPNTARTPQQQEFNTTLSSSTNTWSDTWAGHWTPISETRSTINSTNGTATATASGAAATTSSAAKEGLSTGAKAGIGLGCAAVLALVAGVGLYLSRSRSRARTTSEASSQRPAVVKENERQGMKGPDIPPLVQAADPEPVEIQDKEPLHELPTEVR